MKVLTCRPSSIVSHSHCYAVLKVYSVTVPENIRVGSQVIQVTAVDPDEGRNSALRYDMSSSSPSSAWFSVNRNTGLVRVMWLDTRQGSSHMARARQGGEITGP